MKTCLNKRYIFFCILSTALCLQGCLQQDSTGDTTQQEQNRQRSVADAVANQDAPLKGQYTGTFKSSKILLTLDIATQNSTGNGDLSLVPQPTFIGNLNLTPEVFVTNNSQPLTIPYAVTGGQTNGSTLTLNVQENGVSTILLCKQLSINELNCDWYVHSGSEPKVSFILDRLTPGQESNLKSEDFGGTYIGSNASFKEIKAQFQTILSPQSATNSMPQITIAGSFQFDNHIPIGFNNGEYDPISNKIVTTITMDSTVVVNCVIQSSSSLHCDWIGTGGISSNQGFDLTKAQ